MTTAFADTAHPPDQKPRPARLSALRAQHLLVSATLRWAPAFTAGLIAYFHLGRVGDGVLVGFSVLAAELALEPRRYPTDLLPAATIALRALAPLLGVLFAYLISLPIATLDLAALGAPVLAAWVVLAVCLLTLHRSSRELQARVAVIGPPELAVGLARELRVTGTTSHRVVGWIDRREGERRQTGSTELGPPEDAEEERRNGDDRRWPRLPDFARLGSIREVDEIVARGDIDLLVNGAEGAASAKDEGASPLEVVDRVAQACLGRDVRMIGLNQLSEQLFGHVSLTTMNAAFLQYVMHPRFRRSSPIAKRSLDLAGAGLLSLLTLPIVGICAAATKLSRLTGGAGGAGGAGRTVFTREPRVGAGGYEFDLLSLRVPRSLRFLNRFHVDGIPHLWSVVRGEMSLVGPAAQRPDAAAELEWEIPFFDRRELAKPGLTGWAQVRCGADLHGSQALAACHDLYYLKHRSTSLDLVILLQASSTGARRLVHAGEPADDAVHSFAGVGGA